MVQRLASRVGAATVAMAMALRLFGGQWAAMAGNVGMLTLLVWLQTGRWVTLEAEPEYPTEIPKPTQLPAQTQPVQPEPSQPTVPPEEENELPVLQAVFSPEDALGLAVTYGCSHRPALQELLLMPLSWNLKTAEPTVLILHSHATESYTQLPGEDYAASGSYRTLDTRYNMISVGEEIAKVLRDGGIGVVHDRTLHDDPYYNGAYSSSRSAVEAYLSRYPSIRLVLDIHRDASGGSGPQLTTQAWVEGELSSQLMLVVGTHTEAAPHGRWQQNLSLALKLQAWLQRENPGLCRPVNLRDWTFNQDLAPGCLLVEVGAAGDSHAQALAAARALAEGILALAYGSA